MKVNHIYQGDALEVLQSLEAQQVDMCVTSPPYWGLRDYGVDGQLGLEPDFNEYIDKLCTIFDEVRRVLKNGGTCWVNIGDSYGGNQNRSSQRLSGDHPKDCDCSFCNLKRPDQKCDIKSKSLIGIPFRFAIEMINRGWILRNTIIWHKKNCMPSSVKDRFTVDFEYLFFFSKNKKYYFEQQFEPIKTESLKRIMQPNFDNQKGGDKDYGKTGVNPSNSMRKSLENWKKSVEKRTAINGQGNGELGNNKRFGSNIENGRNKRCVWNISTKPYKGAHFAVFPEDLIETPIKAGCPAQICNQCNEPKIKIIKSSGAPDDLTRPKANKGNMNHYKLMSGPQLAQWKQENPDKIINSDCGCGAGFHPGTVLDPFMGSGTTASVAKRLNRNYVGIELNPEYHGLIHERLDKTARIKPLTEYGCE